MNVVSREAARLRTGRFGMQSHTQPEAALSSGPGLRSKETLGLVAEAAQLRTRLAELDDVLVEERIIDTARALPADARQVLYRVDPATEDGPKMLMFEYVATEDGNDIDDIGHGLREHLYEVGFSFGSGSDLDYRGWLEGDDEYVALDVDEAEADRLIGRYRADIARDMQEYGIVDPQLRRGLDVWLERSVRMRAHEKGITGLHLRFAEDGPGCLEVVSFQTVDGHTRPIEGDPDHEFILARVQQFGYRSAGMTENDRPDAPLTLTVR